MSAVASLARPSPSSTTTSRRGTPSRRTIESGATTSGRHNGAEHEPDRKRHAEQPMRDCGHRTGGEDDTTNCQQRDRPQIETKLAPAHGDARGVDQRRQDPEQYQFRSELYARQARNERKPDAGDDEKDRGSGVEPPCHNGHDDKHRDQQQKRLDRYRHGSTPFRATRRANVSAMLRLRLVRDRCVGSARSPHPAPPRIQMNWTRIPHIPSMITVATSPARTAPPTINRSASALLTPCAIMTARAPAARCARTKNAPSQ